MKKFKFLAIPIILLLTAISFADSADNPQSDLSVTTDSATMKPVSLFTCVNISAARFPTYVGTTFPITIPRGKTNEQCMAPAGDDTPWFIEIQNQGLNCTERSKLFIPTNQGWVGGAHCANLWSFFKFDIQLPKSTVTHTAVVRLESSIDAEIIYSGGGKFGASSPNIAICDKKENCAKNHIMQDYTNAQTLYVIDNSTDFQ